MKIEDRELYLLGSRLEDRKLPRISRFLTRCTTDILDFLESKETSLETYLEWEIPDPTELFSLHSEDPFVPYLVTIGTNGALQDLLLSRMSSGDIEVSHVVLRSLAKDPSILDKYFKSISVKEVKLLWLPYVSIEEKKNFIGTLDNVEDLRDIRRSELFSKEIKRDLMDILATRAANVCSDSELLYWLMEFQDDMYVVAKVKGLESKINIQWGINLEPGYVGNLLTSTSGVGTIVSSRSRSEYKNPYVREFMKLKDSKLSTALVSNVQSSGGTL